MIDPVLQLNDIKVAFGSAQVLKGINLEVGSNEIVAILGANGAGKSTLMNVLSGKISFYEGQVNFKGQPEKLSSPQQAMGLGIEMVQQELGLLPDLNAVENILLGREPQRCGVIDRREAHQMATKALARLCSDFPVDIPVKELSPSRQQQVALARALLQKPSLLILDEPTSMITAEDVDQLFGVLKELRDEGVAILFISHKFNEVYELADRAVVLRDGVVAGAAKTTSLTDDQIITWMVGEQQASRAHEERGVANFSEAPVLLSLDQLTSSHCGPLSLQVRQGEVVGLIGLVGSGRSEILRLIAGVDEALSGQLLVDGAPVQGSSVTSMMEQGVLLLPEDRKSQGLFLDQTLGFNALIYNLSEYSQHGVLNRGAEARAFAGAQNLNETNVNDHSRLAWTLSGGNQQRLMLGKTLLRGSKVLLLDELSAGVDITTRNESLRRVREFADMGMGIVFSSSHWEEVTLVADRYLVIVAGKIIAEFTPDQGSNAAFMQTIVDATHDADPGVRTHG